MYRLRIRQWPFILVVAVSVGVGVLVSLLQWLLPNNPLVAALAALAAVGGTVKGGYELWDRLLAGRHRPVLASAVPVSRNDYLDSLIKRLSAEQDQYVPLAGQRAPYEGYDADYSAGGHAAFVREYQDIGQALADERHRRSVIIGEPGAGKTTTLRMLALAATRAHTLTGNDRDPAIRALYGDDRQPPLPLWVDLGRADNPPQAEQMLLTWWNKHENLTGSVTDAMRRGQVWLFLDGLNEMPNQEASREERVGDLCRLLEREEFRDLRLVATCREHDYVGDMRLGLPVVRVRPLDDPRIEAFAKLRLKSGANGFLKALGELTHLRELGRNPYTLVRLIEVYNEGEPLPQTLKELHTRHTQIRYAHEKEHGRVRLPLARLEKRMQRLAFRMIEDGKGTVANECWAQWQVGRQALDDAFQMNLLVAEGWTDVARFYHQSLHQYFALPGLSHRLESGIAPFRVGFIRQIADLGEGAAPAIPALIRVTQRAKKGDVLAAALVALSHINKEVFRKAFKHAWEHAFLALPPKERVRWGYEIALADARSGVSVRNGLPDIEWCDIPGISGWRMTTHEGLMAHETHVQTHDIAPFRLAKYPITHSQFQTFLDADDGWNRDFWWAEWDRWRTQGHALGKQGFRCDNHPREQVSWLAAMSFCAWLSARLGYPTLHQWLEGGKHWKSYSGVRLPTEWEWQWAAQGPDGRRYPYGNVFDVSKSNTLETRIGHTSAVGIFPEGASPYSVLDMSGNVWEWCLNDYDDPSARLGSDATHVRRGGSFANGQVSAYTSYRSFSPYIYDSDTGFRICMSLPPAQ